jgi:hypothetical protein
VSRFSSLAAVTLKTSESIVGNFGFNVTRVEDEVGGSVTASKLGLLPMESSLRL